MPGKAHLIDLHTHSTASDGKLSPTELVRAAAAAGLGALGLTDHETTAGHREAAEEAARAGVCFVPGVEFSAECVRGTMHLLGYFIDGGHPRIVELVGRYQADRVRRNARILERLSELGCPLSMEEVARHAGSDFIGRPHVADALVEKGHARSRDDAFKRFLARGGPAYEDRYRAPRADAIAAIHAAGGIAAIAHPSHLGCDNDAELERVLRSLMCQGLDALEVYHPDHSPGQVRRYLDLANKLGLPISGGSDFHGRPAGQDGRGDALGRTRVPIAVLAVLREAHAKRRQSGGFADG